MRKSTLIVFATLTLFGLLMTNCGGDDGPNGPVADTTRPTVVNTNPTNGATAVDVGITISAIFSEPVNINTVTSSTFSASPAITGLRDVDNSVATITPDDDLAYSTTYTVTLHTGITDTADNALADAYVWSFTTGADPALIPPEVVNTNPVNGATGVAATGPFRVTFSKAMDPATLTDTTFSIEGATGSVSYTDLMATYTPDPRLEYNTAYTATVTTVVADTFGNDLPAEYSWNFTTGDDPLIPIVDVLIPWDSSIVGDSVIVAVGAAHPVGVERVEFYIDGVYQAGADDYTEPFLYSWDASSLEIGSYHTITARGYDAEGHVGYGDTMTVVYKWEIMATDGNAELLPQDVRRVLARSTDTVLELRYEFSANWIHAYYDTGVDLAIYIDADMNPATGLTEFSAGSLNGIGADYRMILGLHGGETCLSLWTGDWVRQFDTTGLVYHNISQDTNVMEIGIRWSDLTSGGVYLVNVNAFFFTNESWAFDWVPDQGNGYIFVPRVDRYIGESSVGSSPWISGVSKQTPKVEARPERPNPFAGP